MLIFLRRFALTGGILKIIGTASLVLCLIVFFFAGRERIVKTDAVPEESMGGRENEVTADQASLETEGLSEPAEFAQPRMLLFTSYQIKQGDVLGEVAKRFGLSGDTLMSVNNLKNANSVQLGQTLRVPNQDGIFYAVKKGDTLKSIGTKYKVEPEKVQVANELFSDQINPNTSLFLPGAVIPQEELQPQLVSRPQPPQLDGDLFLWPVRGRLTSYYGRRRSPFSRGWSFHDGLDVAAPTGTPVKAAMAGRVTSVGWDNTYGNMILITHADGYKTLYGHLDSIDIRAGTSVAAGTVIGTVGNTGLSTGPHLHFTVYKDGSSVNPRKFLR
ncbi:MAG: M23 family metallopeptidase [Treponema sp.]|jgi:murein DD-endopeptidase MepM/ murein hydrolase activator NlpD|nr:M23 family metallopeptidase [Treponema sp.]